MSTNEAERRPTGVEQKWVLAATSAEGANWIGQLTAEERPYFSSQRILTPNNVGSFHGTTSPTVVAVGRMRDLLEALRIARAHMRIVRG